MSARTRAEAGACFLDRRKPNWHKKFENKKVLDQLEIYDPDRCVLAVVSGNFGKGCSQFKLNDEEPVRLGVDLTIQSFLIRLPLVVIGLLGILLGINGRLIYRFIGMFNRLNPAWRQCIKERLAQDEAERVKTAETLIRESEKMPRSELVHI